MRLEELRVNILRGEVDKMTQAKDRLRKTSGVRNLVNLLPINRVGGGVSPLNNNFEQTKILKSTYEFVETSVAPEILGYSLVLMRVGQ